MRNCFLGTLLATFAFISISNAAADQAKSMNVVFILADDLGWSDTELYGKTKLYNTPNILHLAELGCAFDRAYSNSPLCSPTRASFLTGQRPTRLPSRLENELSRGFRFRSLKLVV